MSERVKHPDHYNWHPSGVECIDIIRVFSYNRATAMAYIWRAGKKKDCDEVEDLKKAIFHLQDEVDSIERDRAKQSIATIDQEEALHKPMCEPSGIVQPIAKTKPGTIFLTDRDKSVTRD